MQTRTFAAALGIIFLVIGILGFVPPLLAPPPEPIAVEPFHGLLFGLFPVNILHNLFHIGFGIWGVIAYQRFEHARTFAQVTAIVYAVLIVFGFIPGLRTLFGLVPLHGHVIWLHALIALAAAYFGFRPVRAEPAVTGSRSV